MKDDIVLLLKGRVIRVLGIIYGGDTREDDKKDDKEDKKHRSI